MQKSFSLIFLIFALLFGAVSGGNLYAQNAPTVVEVLPARNSIQNSPTVAISARFDSGLNGATVTDENVLVYGDQSGRRAGALSYNAGAQTITFTPAAAFQAGERVTIILTSNITGSNGAAIAGFQWSFHIISLPSTAVFDLDSTYAAGNGPHFIGAGEFNGAPGLDLAIPYSANPHQVVAWNNDGAGNFIAADVTAVGLRPRSLAIADLNQDGALDVAAANEGAATVSILLNNGAGDFNATATLPVGLEPNQIASGDLNNDGLLDLVTANSTASTLSLLLNTGGGVFAAAISLPLPSSPQATFIADFDNDGFADIAVTTADNDSVAVLLNDGAGNFTALPGLPSGNGPRAIGGGDFNKDGFIDLVVTNRDGDNVAVFLNTFNIGGSFSPPNNYPVGGVNPADPITVAVGDWDGDGNLDFAVSNRLANDLWIFRNNGAGFFQFEKSYPLGAEPRGLNAGDFNGDGIVDLAAANFIGDSFQVFFNNFGAGLNSPPAAPVLTAPADRAAFNPNITTIQLSWNVPADSDNNQLHFAVEIDDAPTFASPNFTVDSRTNVAGFNPAPPAAPGAGSVTYTVSAALLDGVYFWRVRAWDGLAFGAYSTPARRFIVDTAAPNIDRVVITDPAAAPNWYNPTTTPSINFGAQYDETRAQRAEFNLGALGGTTTLSNIPSGQDHVAQTSVSISAANDGAYPLAVAIFDSAGNQAGTNAVIRLDKTPPTGTRASSPPISPNTSFTVSWGGGSDDGGSGLSGVYDVRVKINNGPFTEWLSNFQGAAAEFQGEDGGAYAFEAAAYDSVGNRELFTGVAETTTLVDINANDTQAPGPPVALTANGANPSPWQNTPQFQIQWQPPSDPSGIDEAFYKLGSAPIANSDFTGSAAGGTTSVQVTATQQNGQNFYLWFSDGNGNVDFRNHGVVQLRFDNTPPTGTVASSPEISANLSFTVSWGGGSDGGSGLSGMYDVRVKVNNNPFSNWKTNFQGTSDIFTGENGSTYAFEAAAHDQAGNVEVFTGAAETTTLVDITANDTQAPGPPTNLIAAGANPSPWQNTPQFEIQWQPPADPSGIRRALYKLGNAPTANFDTTAAVTSGNSATVTATQPDGQNFYLWFEDQRGNVDFQNNGRVQLRFDNAAPVVRAIQFLNADFVGAGLNWFNPALTEQAEARITYDERHLHRIQLQSATLGVNRDVTNVPSGLGVSRQFNIDIEGEPDGSHKLQFTLTDSAGNSKIDSTRIAFDSTPPTGTRAVSPVTSGSTIFLVTWGATGSDGSGSGLAGEYDVRVRVDGGPWQNWLTKFAGASSNFTGEDGKEYGFEAAAYDRVGNREAFNNQAESVTVVDLTFQDVQAPVIVHTPVSEVEEGQSVTLRAQISDNNQVAEARLFFKRSGEVSFQSQQMTNTDANDFEFTLSADQISIVGVNYFISANDGANFSFHPPTDAETRPYNISVRISGANNQGLVKSEPQPGGGSESSYRMISVPLNLQSGNPLSVLQDDLGDYDPNVWRLFQYNPATDQYTEYPSVASFTPGKALWLIVRAANRIIDSGVGVTAPTNQPFTINLGRGWNDIAAPFPFAVEARDTLLLQGSVDDIVGPYTFQGDWLLPNQVTIFSPWEGYSFYSDNPATIAILPIASTVPAQTLAKPAFDADWHVAISASSGELRDGSNYLGVSSQALPERDALDYLEPPYLANRVSVTFPHHDWSGVKGEFTTDFRPHFEDGQVWSFEVKSTVGNLPAQTGRPITLRFENLESLPPQFQAVLLDKQSLKTIELRQNIEYVFTLEKSESKREFELVIGTQEYISNSEVLNDPIPQEFSLSQNYPNPFNAGTSISYRVAEAAQISIKVFNILGQEVRELVSQRQAPGVYRVHWDGRADNGVEIGSGIYLIKMQAGSFQQIRKVALVR